MDDTILETKGLTKVPRLRRGQWGRLRIKRGEIHALIGPNGAGKTTCFNLLTKFLSPSGTIKFNGVDITGERPRRSRARRDPLVPDLGGVPAPDRVGERAHWPAAQDRPVVPLWRSDRQLASLNAPARELLEQVDLGAFADETTVNLPYGRKRALEIATTLAMEPS